MNKVIYPARDNIRETVNQEANQRLGNKQLLGLYKPFSPLQDLARSLYATITVLQLYKYPEARE